MYIKKLIFLGPIVLYRPNAYNNKTAFITTGPIHNCCLLKSHLNIYKKFFFVCVLSGSAVKCSTGNRGVARSPPAHGTSAGDCQWIIIQKVEYRKIRGYTEEVSNTCDCPDIGQILAHTQLRWEKKHWKYRRKWYTLVCRTLYNRYRLLVTCRMFVFKM